MNMRNKNFNHSLEQISLGEYVGKTMRTLKLNKNEEIFYLKEKLE